MPIGWRLTTLLAGAGSLGLSLTQLIGLPARLGWTGEVWLAATGRGSAYALSGPVAALIDVGAILLCAVLARFERDRHAFVWTIAAAGLFAASLIAWTLLVLPMTEIMAAWPKGTVPSDFPIVRDQWETGHAVMAGLKLAGFLGLAAGLLGAGALKDAGRAPGGSGEPEPATSSHDRTFRLRTDLRRTGISR